LRSKAADLRTAFRILNTDLMRYRIGQYTASQLIESYSNVEERIGRSARAAAPQPAGAPSAGAPAAGLRWIRPSMLRSDGASSHLAHHLR
jgi:hypothetical protein